MKPKNLLNYHSNTAPLGEPSQQPKEHPNSPPAGKITNGAMNRPPVRFSNGLTRWLDVEVPGERPAEFCAHDAEAML